MLFIDPETVDFLNSFSDFEIYTGPKANLTNFHTPQNTPTDQNVPTDPKAPTNPNDHVDAEEIENEVNNDWANRDIFTKTILVLA